MKNIFTHNFGKFKMVLDKEDPDVSKQIFDEGWYAEERFDVEIFQQHLKVGMTFVDLGANVGFYAILGSTIVGEKGRVFAFEPFPRNVRLIKASVKENLLSNVFIVQAAVSDRNGKATLHLSPEASSEHSLLDLDFRNSSSRNPRRMNRSIPVKVVTLDDYFEAYGDFNIDFVKMDIEGSEYSAVEGMQRILERNKRIIIMMEFWPNGFRKAGHDPYEFLESLVRKRFRIRIIDPIEQSVYAVEPRQMKQIEKIRTRDVSKQNKVMQIWGWYTNLLCMRD